MLRRITVLLVATVALMGAPATAFADHDCGPPPKHSDHSKAQEDRKNPCR